MKPILIVTCLLILFALMPAEDLEDKIVFAEKNCISVSDLNGKNEFRITLPSEIKSAFRLKKDYVIYSDNNYLLKLYNWKQKKIIQIPSGPYFYNKKIKSKYVTRYYGPERYIDLDFNSKRKLIAVVIRPLSFKMEYYDNSLKKNIVEKTEFEDLSELDELVLINIDSREKRLVSKDNEGAFGYCKLPFFYKNYLVYNGNSDIYYFNLNNNKQILLSEFFNKFKKIEENESELLQLISLKNNKVFFFIIKDLKENNITKKYIEIYSYFFESNEFKKMRELKNLGDYTLNDFSINILDISGDGRFILTNEGYNLLIVNLETKERKTIDSSPKRFYNAYFLENCDLPDESFL